MIYYNCLNGAAQRFHVSRKYARKKHAISSMLSTKAAFTVTQLSVCDSEMTSHQIRGESQKKYRVDCR